MWRATSTFVNQRFAEWLGFTTWMHLAGMKFDEVDRRGHTVRTLTVSGGARSVPYPKRRNDLPAQVLQSTYDDVGVTRTRSIVIRDTAIREALPGRGTYERFRGLFDSAPVAIAITDSEGLIADCNQAFETPGRTSEPRGFGGVFPLADRLSGSGPAPASRSRSRQGSERVTATGLHLDVSVMTARRRVATASRKPRCSSVR